MSEMICHKLSAFTKGWFIGNFDPTLFKNEVIEIAIKKYSLGDSEQSHYHAISTEWTCVVTGRIRMNGEIFIEGDIIEIPPGEIMYEFLALEDSITVVAKRPSVSNDKFIV